MQLTGLTDKEVEQRRQQGLVNLNTDVKTKTIGQIVAGHTLTLFNALNAGLALALILVGSFKNMLFVGVVLCNTAIGIFQEIRSKKMVDQLAIVVSHQVQAVRNGKEQQLPVEEIVMDDLLHLGRGSQVPADCRIVQGSCYMNESLITGEADLIRKKAGDILLSGSFVAAGDCLAQTVHVGKDNYAAQISSEAKKLKAVNSEIMSTLKKIIQYISCVILPLGVILFYNQYTIPGATIHAAVVNTVAALIGMIPEGLVLLTSSVLAVSVIRLARHKVLVQQLYCIETLARVDVLCLDKTGTITCDEMKVDKLIPFPEASESELKKALRSLAASSRDTGSTMEAVRSYGDTTDVWQPVRIVDFASERKWSGASFENGKTYVIGAGEMIFGERYAALSARLRQETGLHRVLTVAGSKHSFGQDEQLPRELEPMGFVLIQDAIRPEAEKTIRYFCEQGVELKVISGDSVETVSKIAKQVGIPGADRAVDARSLQTDAQMAAAAEAYQVFGRVMPEQKKQLVMALKAKGHTVAMTGDGVNDVLALREADCSVAMAAGSDAARNVAQLVLTDNNFASMPRVVAEGRRAINNIQRSASLFLVKTLFSICISILFVFINMRYPFQPIQLTFISMFTIGLPSFVLALEPNQDKIQGNFFFNILARAIAGAMTMTLGIILAYSAEYAFRLSYEQTSTLAVLLTAVTGLYLLFRISMPFNWVRRILMLVSTGGIVCGMIWGGSLLGLVPLTRPMALFAASAALVDAAVFGGLFASMERIRIRKMAGHSASRKE